jgi:hypothetical protein
MTGRAIWLMASLFLAHFLGDFTRLSTKRMQKAKATGRPVGPILAHGAVHGFLVGIAVAAVASPGMSVLIAAMGVEFVTHFGIDWIRGRLGEGRPNFSSPESPAFWTVLGLDQLAHYLVLLWIAALVF